MRFSAWPFVGFLLWVTAAAPGNTSAQDTVLERIPARWRGEVQEIVTDPTFVRTLDLEAAAAPQVFAYLLDHPDLNATLARALAIAPHRLVRVGAGRYQGDDGAGNAGTLELLWAGGDQRVLLERGVSPRWWFGDIGGRVVAVVDFSAQGDQVRGQVTAWARIDHGLMDRLLRLLGPVLGGFLDRKLREQFAITFRVAERAARTPQEFCRVLAGLAEGSPEDRKELTGLAECPDPARPLDPPPRPQALSRDAPVFKGLPVGTHTHEVEEGRDAAR